MKNMDPVMKLAKDNNYLPWSRNFENDNFFLVAHSRLEKYIILPAFQLCKNGSVDLLLAVLLKLIFPFLQGDLSVLQFGWHKCLSDRTILR